MTAAPRTGGTPAVAHAAVGAPDPSWSPASPTSAQLVRQIRDVVADLPWFVASPLLRHWHRTWGATAAEVDAPMPGDDLLPDAPYRATRAITIDAPPEDVWPWLVQVGCRRGGWYADDLLDNFAQPSERRVVPQLQHVEVGQLLPMVPWVSEHRSFVVDGFVADRWLLWTTPVRTWAWRLDPLPQGRTRLVTRLHTAYRLPHPAAVGTVLLMELGDFPMMRRMLRGIRDRAGTTTTPTIDGGRR